MPRTFRFKFNRIGPMCYIGHLDMMRYMQKAVMRAALDVRYSEGYHPHQIMSFAYPLGVGMETHGDYVDIDLNSVTVEGKIYALEEEATVSESLSKEMCLSLCTQMNAVLQEGAEILSVSLVPLKAENAMASVSAASYSVLVPLDLAIDSDKITSYLSQDEILVEKDGKKGPVLKNIKDGIFALTYETGKFYMFLNSGSSLNIKPADVLQSLALYLRMDNIKILHIIREETFRNDGDKQVPLGYD